MFDDAPPEQASNWHGCISPRGTEYSYDNVCSRNNYYITEAGKLLCIGFCNMGSHVLRLDLGFKLASDDHEES